MKKTPYILFAILLGSLSLTAQVNERITTLLKQFPTQNAKQQQKNMADMAALGKSGIAELAARLSSSDKPEHTKVQYAISGFTYFVTQNDKEEWRKIATEAYTEALGKITNKDNQAFLLFQLQQVGKEDAVGTLSAYLNDATLSGPAARALGKIGTASAAKVLLQALTGATASSQISIIEALGDGKFAEAAPIIEKLTNNADKNTRKVVLYALANIGVPSSENFLMRAAQQVAYGYDETNATSSYLTYLARLVENGHKALAQKSANALLNNALKQTPTRTGALKVLADAQGVASVPILVNALKNTDINFRAAALKLAQKYINPTTTNLWIRALPTLSADAQAEVIGMLGQVNAPTALPAILKNLTHKQPVVKLAAIQAATQIGQESILPPLMRVLKTGNEEEVKAVKNALLVMKGQNVVNQIATALPTMPANAQTALIEVLSERAADDKIATILDQLKNSNPNVKAAAFTALRTVSNVKDLSALYEILNTATAAQEVQATQEAITEVLKEVGEAPQQAEMLLTQINAVPSEQKPNYLRILANIGTKKALDFVANAFASGDATTQKAALNTLANWSDVSATSELYKIGKTTTDATYLDQAVGGFVRAVNASKQTPTQKVLMLRKAMNMAKTVAQQENILKELVRNRTFNALIFAGQYLNEPALQQTAAQVVINAALANKDFQGETVKTLLGKAINITNNSAQKEAAQKYLAEMPKGEGFVSLFNGKDLTGWKGLVGNPIARAKMHPDTLAAKQAKADEIMRKGWVVKDGELLFTGHGDNLCTIKKYGDFEMYVDWKIEPKGDAGIYLRGSPQVQVWDTSRVEVGAQVGSGGLYNNQKNPSKPLKVADNAINDWNTFRILMKADRVTVWLNGELVVDNVTLENYWDRKQPIFPTEQLELQAHGTLVAYRDIYVRELPRPEPFMLSEQESKEGFKVLFDGTNMFEWIGNTTDYVIEDGSMVIYPNRGGKGNLYTKDEYSDFEYRFEFMLTPGANNGLGIRAPLEGDAAYVGIELQILDNEAEIYKSLQPYQYHGSAYGIIPAKRGYLKPVGEWNYQEVVVKGSKIKVTLNGTVILDGDLAEASKNGTADHRDHPGLSRTSGHIGYLGHGDVVRFRNIRVKDLTVPIAVEQPVVEEKVIEKKKRRKK
jgi:HEAT repeat protein